MYLIQLMIDAKLIEYRQIVSDVLRGSVAAFKKHLPNAAGAPPKPSQKESEQAKTQDKDTKS